jgi:hypothetical protein
MRRVRMGYEIFDLLEAAWKGTFGARFLGR